MFVLIILAVTAAGQVAMQTLSFSSEKHCKAAATQLHQSGNQDVKVTAVCIERGLTH